MSMEAAVPKNLSLRPQQNARAIRARLMAPPNGRESSELDVVSDYVAQRIRSEKFAALAAEEKQHLRADRKQRGIEMLLKYQAELNAWIEEAGPDPDAPVMPRATVLTILQAVAVHYALDALDIVSGRRTGDIVLPRHIAMYLARRHTACSFPMIGSRIGGRDHTTVLHAVQKIERMLRDGDEALAAHIKAIEQIVGIK